MVPWLVYIGSCQCDCIFRFHKEVGGEVLQKRSEAPFMGLAKLKHSSNPETCIFEFLRLSVMVLDLFAARRVYMFIDGLEEPLHGLVNYTKPTTLEYSIKRDGELQYVFPKANATFQ